ncbi:MAG: hypothetical protein M1833_003118 [Piccolia ochrophora]|nr:MAG: hypothetical protein M1833_003118 [Piccolia ochrophora]
MQASRRVCIFEQSPPKTTQLAFSIHKNSQHSEEEDTPSPQNHPSSSSEDGTRDGEGPAETPDEEQKKSDPVDPLQWFGMIVPPALRATQSHFLEAVTDTIPKLVNTNQELKRVEAAIWKARKGRLQNQ